MQRHLNAPVATSPVLRGALCALGASLMMALMGAAVRMASTEIPNDGQKLANQYTVRARKAIQSYFGPDSTQYARCAAPVRPIARRAPARGLAGYSSSGALVLHGVRCGDYHGYSGWCWLAMDFHGAELT